MTTVRQIIARSGRIVAQVDEGRPAAVAYQADMALTIFNAMLREMRGREIGQRLRRNWTASAGDTACAGGWYAVNIDTPAEPKNGDRIGVIGACTVTATDGTIEDAASVTTTAGASWFYREDLADWLKEEDRGLDDAQPLASEADESLAMMLAARWYFENNEGDVPQVLATQALAGRAYIRQLYGARVRVDAPCAVLRGLAHRGSWPSDL